MPAVVGRKRRVAGRQQLEAIVQTIIAWEGHDDARRRELPPQSLESHLVERGVVDLGGSGHADPAT